MTTTALDPNRVRKETTPGGLTWVVERVEYDDQRLVRGDVRPRVRYLDFRETAHVPLTILTVTLSVEDSGLAEAPKRSRRRASFLPNGERGSGALTASA